MSLDTGSTVAIIIGVVTLVVMVAIAVWQVAAARARPRPHVTIAGPAPPAGPLPIRLRNPGGEAVRCHALAHVGDDFFEFRGSVVAQLQDQEATMMRLGSHSAPKRSDVPLVVWVVAADGRDRWWNVRAGRRIRRPINDWLAVRSQRAGLAIPAQMDLS